MIDEFQDTDPVQFHIIESLQPGPSLMMVGDPKQSIYRFRGAEVSLFTDMKAGHEMSTNFRSSPSLVHFVNTFFEPYFQPYFLKSKPAVTQMGKGIEYWRPISLDSKTAWNAEEGRLKEAAWLAEHLKKIRKTNWKDVAILFRCQRKRFLAGIQSHGASVVLRYRQVTRQFQGELGVRLS